MQNQGGLPYHQPYLSSLPLSVPNHARAPQPQPQAPPPPPFQPAPPPVPGPSNSGPPPPSASNSNVPKKAKAIRKKGSKDDKERKTRSRAACIPCKATKQKCDGPSRIPCRRCELYGLECKFPPTTHVPESALHTSQAGGSAVGSTTESPGVVAQRLFEIASRLKSIEAALHIDGGHSNHTSPMHESSHTPSNIGRSPSPENSDDEMDDDDGRNNPIQMINQSIDDIVGRPFGSGQNHILADDYGAPDALKRNLLTPKECQELFDFFFRAVHPWVMMLSLDEDRDAIGVRSRSPLLFHTILLLASSYSDPFPSHLHASLITFTNAILAPQILSPQPYELTTDFLRAIDLLNLYKPTQFAARRAEGKSDAEAMRASKVNGLASWMLQGILGRTAERLELASIVGKFSRAYQAASRPTDIPPTILRDLRLYFWLLSNDVHGNVQSGRRCNMDSGSALTVTRTFSALQLQPYDTRLAASVEMFEVARPILRSVSYERTRRIARVDLERYNAGMAAWESYWLPILQRQLGVDPLAMSVLSPFQWFITLTFNASGYLSWQSNKLYASDSGGEVDVKPNRQKRAEARGLSSWEFAALGRCVEAAEGLIFTLCEESRVKGGWRKVQWEEAARADGWRKLVLDQSIVELSSWGMDAITCVAYIFPLVFLCRLVNDGILTVDLELIQTPTTQPRWLHPRKLPRLLELGSSFLDAIALNANHPAKSQAQVLRSLLDAGVRGLSPSPQIPRHPGTVTSPAPNPLPAAVASAPVGIFAPQDGRQGAGQPMQWQPPNPAVNPANNANPSGPAATFRQFQPIQATPASSIQTNLQQQQPMNPPMLPRPSGQVRPPSVGGVQPIGGAPGMDQSLTAVLEGFDPSLFGEGTAFWDWGLNGQEMDWSAVQASMRPL